MRQEALWVIVIAAIANPAMFGPFISNAVALSWVPFLIVALLESFRRTPSAVA